MFVWQAKNQSWALNITNSSHVVIANMTLFATTLWAADDGTDPHPPPASPDVVPLVCKALFQKWCHGDASKLHVLLSPRLGFSKWRQ